MVRFPAEGIVTVFCLTVPFIVKLNAVIVKKHAGGTLKGYSMFLNIFGSSVECVGGRFAENQP